MLLHFYIFFGGFNLSRHFLPVIHANVTRPEITRLFRKARSWTQKIVKMKCRRKVKRFWQFVLTVGQSE